MLMCDWTYTRKKSERSWNDEPGNRQCHRYFSMPTILVVTTNCKSWYNVFSTFLKKKFFLSFFWSTLGKNKEPFGHLEVWESNTLKFNMLSSFFFFEFAFIWLAHWWWISWNLQKVFLYLGIFCHPVLITDGTRYWWWFFFPLINYSGYFGSQKSIFYGFKSFVFFSNATLLIMQ